MRAYWSPPGTVLVEVQEGKFKHGTIPQRDLEFLAYIQVWLFVLQHFPSLSNYASLIDKKQSNATKGQADDIGVVDTARIFWLSKLAQQVGFKSDKILQNLKKLPTEQPHNWRSSSTLNIKGEEISRRWGRPFSSAFKHIEKHLFLLALSYTHNEESLN